MELKDILTYGTFLVVAGIFGCEEPTTTYVSGEVIGKPCYSPGFSGCTSEKYTFLLKTNNEIKKHEILGSKATDLKLLSIDEGDSISLKITKVVIFDSYEFLSLNGEKINF
jgi:hypothetical protein